MKSFLVPAIAEKNKNIQIHLASQDPWPFQSYSHSTILIDQAVCHTLLYNNISEHKHIIVVKGSEEVKSIDFLEQIISTHDKALERMQVLIVIGGGALLNLGTALAARLKQFDHSNDNNPHAFDLILIPTTVLAMADVAYGSLGLLNHGTTKNAYRVVYDPDGIILDMRYLYDLPIVEKKRGVAECLKHALLQDSDNQKNTPCLNNCLDLLRENKPNNEALFSCIQQTIMAKAEVIQAIHAGNEAAANLLSYGHVDAEPREAASHYKLAHGDAVLLSLTIELTLSGSKTMLELIHEILPFTQIAIEAKNINFDRTTMLRAYRNSAKQRFRAGADLYRVISLPHKGYYANLQGNTKIEMGEYEFDEIYEVGKKLLNKLSQ